MTIKYGIFFGRMQPIHIGHEHIIDKIISDGLIPIVMLGSTQESGTEKNPYTPEKRIEFIKSVFPDIKIIPIPDKSSYDDWVENTLQEMMKEGINLNEIAIYTHNKDEDRHDFEFRKTSYKNAFYSECFESLGFKMVHAELSDIPIRAKEIRKDLDKNKKWLRPSVYNLLKELT